MYISENATGYAGGLIRVCKSPEPASYWRYEQSGKNAKEEPVSGRDRRSDKIRSGKKSGKAANRSRSKFSAKPAVRAGSGYRIAGKTSDGVQILRAKVGPTHFTAKEVHDVLNELRASTKA